MVLFDNFDKLKERIMKEYDLSETDTIEILELIEDFGECEECFMGDI